VEVTFSPLKGSLKTPKKVTEREEPGTLGRFICMANAGKYTNPKGSFGIPPTYLGCPAGT